MINKLSKRIFFLIMASLETIIIGIIILFAFSNYKNTIDTAGLMMDIFVNNKEKRNLDEKLPQNEKINIEGVYRFKIQNSEILESMNNAEDKTLQEYAIKVSNNNEESGIIGKYIYKLMRRRNEDEVEVTLIENEEVISKVKEIVILSIIGIMASIIIVYIVAKKVSEFIVKPVEETFEKQKQFISDASHELKTPLAVIEANADVLENEIIS